MFSKQFKAVFKNSFTVCAGDPFFLVINLSMVALMLVASAMPSIGNESLRLIRDQTHSIIFICGALAGTMGLIRVITDDIRRGAGAILMSRPVSGTVLISGKLCGVLACVGIMFISGSSAYLWITEIHFEEEINLTSTIVFVVAVLFALGLGAARQYMFGSNFSKYTSCALAVCLVFGVCFRYMAGVKSQFDFNGLNSLFLLYLAIISFASVITVLAVIADSAMVLTGAIIVFFFGLISEYLLTKSLGSVGEVISSIIPNWQNFWILEQLGIGKAVPTNYYFTCAAQSLLTAGFFITLAILFFERAEIKGVA